MPGVQNFTRTLGGQCMGILEKLSNYTCANPELKRTPLATIGRRETAGGTSAGFFRSGFNEEFVGDTIQIQNPRTGTLSHAVFDYLPRTVSANTETVASNSLDVCNSTDDTTYNEVQVTPDGFSLVWQQKRFNKRSWMQICEDPEDAQMRILLSMMDAVLTKCDVEIMRQMIVGAGGNANHPTATAPPVANDITTYRGVDLIDANRMAIWAGVDDMLEDFAVNELDDCPVGVFFGLKNAFNTYKRSEKIGCCNNVGQDAAAVAAELDYAPFVSRNVEAAFVGAGLTAAVAPRASLIAHPGASHLIEIYDNLHSPMADGMSFSMMWTDEQSGETFDFEVQYDRCSKNIIITVYKKFKVFNMPTDQFATGDHLFQTNGLMLYDFVRL